MQKCSIVDVRPRSEYTLRGEVNNGLSASVVIKHAQLIFWTSWNYRFDLKKKTGVAMKISNRKDKDASNSDIKA